MGKSKGMIKRRGTSEPMEEKVQSIPRLAKKSNSTPLEYASLALKKKNYVAKMTPKPAQTIKTGGASERVKSSTPQMSMAQIGKSMSKSGPRKNLRETAAVVKGKLQNAYNKATKRKTISMEMDGKTFTGTEKVGKRSVVKVKNPELGSRKIVDVYTSGGDLKRQRIVDRDASGKKIKVTKQGPDSDILARRAARKNR
jgi:hypothetical protein